MDSDLTPLRAAIVASFPELRSARFNLHIGWGDDQEAAGRVAE